MGPVALLSAVLEFQDMSENVPRASSGRNKACRVSNYSPEDGSFPHPAVPLSEVEAFCICSCRPKDLS